MKIGTPVSRLISGLVLGAALALSSVACTNQLTADLKTQAQADPRVDFKGMETYAWAGGAGIQHDPNGYWAPSALDIGAELKLLIDSEMQARGFKESPNADMLIAFLVVNDVQELKMMEEERGADVPDLVGVGKGALLIEIMDAGTGRTIWVAGTSAETQSGRPSEEVKERLQFAVRESFKQLP